jgi:hypothetical protein
MYKEMSMGSQDDIFSGIWRCTHWYPSKDDASELSDEHEMRAHRDGEDVVFESMPDAHGSYMFVRVSIHGDVATGTWHETASADGNFQSANYSGAGQLLVDQEGKHMDGQWAGVGFDRAQNKQRVYSGRWEMTYVGEQVAEV